MKGRCYIAGPMRGIPLFNFPAFDEAKATVRAMGYEAVSPADLDRAAGFDPMSLPPDWDWGVIPPTFDMRAAMDRDIAAVRLSAAIYMLDGWEKSVGATAEYHLARWCGLEVHFEKRGVETVLQEAARLTSEDRQKVYGHPSRDLSRTARLWTAYLDGRTNLSPRDVCWMMALLKSSRDRNRPHRDALVDGCGYLRCAEMVETVTPPHA